jgi:hypothetical protein
MQIHQQNWREVKYRAHEVRLNSALLAAMLPFRPLKIKNKLPILLLIDLSDRQGRTQGECTGCTCIPPPPLCIPPGHVHPPPSPA